MSDDQLNDASPALDAALRFELPAADPPAPVAGVHIRDWSAGFRRRRWLLRYLSMRGVCAAGREAIERAVQLGIGNADEMLGSYASLWEQGMIRLVDGHACILTKKGMAAAAFARAMSAKYGDPPVPIPYDLVPKHDWTYGLE